MGLLNIRHLKVQFGNFPAVDGVDLTLDAGELLGIVGESGSGKSVTMLALMGLIDAPGKVTADALEFQGRDLLKLNASEHRALIGRDVAMVFQDALSSLNPSYTVGAQIAEVLKAHLGPCAARRQGSASSSCWSSSRSPTPPAARAPTRTSSPAA